MRCTLRRLPRTSGATISIAGSLRASSASPGRRAGRRTAPARGRAPAAGGGGGRGGGGEDGEELAEVPLRLALVVPDQPVRQAEPAAEREDQREHERQPASLP